MGWEPIYVLNPLPPHGWASAETDALIEKAQEIETKFNEASNEHHGATSDEGKAAAQAEDVKAIIAAAHEGKTLTDAQSTKHQSELDKRARIADTQRKAFHSMHVEARQAAWDAFIVEIPAMIAAVRADSLEASKAYRTQLAKVSALRTRALATEQRAGFLARLPFVYNDHTMPHVSVAPGTAYPPVRIGNHDIDVAAVLAEAGRQGGSVDKAVAGTLAGLKDENNIWHASGRYTVADVDLFSERLAAAVAKHDESGSNDGDVVTDA